MKTLRFVDRDGETYRNIIIDKSRVKTVIFDPDGDVIILFKDKNDKVNGFRSVESFGEIVNRVEIR